jgi:hypothetical protein
MRLRFCFAIRVLVATITGIVAHPSLAHDVPEKLAYYYLLPRNSALRQSDGIAAVDYQLFGYVMVRYGGIWSTNASFEIASVWGSLPSDNPVLAMDIDVNETLSLENLNGAVLPAAAPTEVYQFRGHTLDGSPINLFAAMTGPWIYLRGGSEPPAGGANYITYSTRALGRSRPFADFNGDGIVDGADYVTSRKAPDADAQFATTYYDWATQFGERLLDLDAMDAIINAAAGTSVTTATVPEPTSVGLAPIAGVLLGTRRRRCLRSRATAQGADGHATQ